MIFSSATFFSALSLASVVTILPAKVHSHGFVWDPMGRNKVANMYGVGSGSGSNTKPIRTYNHPGLDNGGDTFGACGARYNQDRKWTKPDEWVTPAGNTVPFQAQATYTEGQDIIIRSYLTANHRGHIEMYACSDLDNPTDACFRNNPLDFVEDLLHGAPKDDAYPLRAMIAPPSAADPNAPVNMTLPTESGDLYVHKFRLPQDLYGDEILLQWYWITANGCRAPGYVDYPWPNNDWHPSGSLNKVCELPYADCSRDTTGLAVCKDPQIFRNCIEVKIEQGGPPAPTNFPSPTPSLRPSLSTAPSKHPVTIIPTPFPTYQPTLRPSAKPSLRPSMSITPSSEPTKSPSSAPNSAAGCCSQNYKDCHPDSNASCNQDEASCTSCGRVWLAGGAQSGCLAYNTVGCNANSPCCEGLECKADGANGKCFIDNSLFP